MNDIFTVLGNVYGPKFFDQEVNDCAKQLSEKGILMFPGFLKPCALSAIQKEAQFLKPNAYQSSSEYNVYVKPQDPDFSPDSPRNRLFGTTKKCIPDDLLPWDSILRVIYDNPMLRQFFADVLGVSQLYPYADRLSSINVNYYDEGDSLEWHFDNSDFTITLLVKACEAGGVYEYCTDMRYDSSGEENYDLVGQILDGVVPPEQEFVDAGDLMIFKGNKSLHRVTEIEKGERILVTFNFNTEEGVALSEQSRKTFFGRV